jgi:aminomethyltransferase
MSSQAAVLDPQLLQTPLHAAHVALGARMVPFAGYDMPVQYREGILKEHLWTRTHAGLFDVSHMGQARLTGADPFAVLERLTPGRFAGLAGRQRYSVLLNAEGGILDDLMVAEPVPGAGAFLIVNASRKADDFALIASSAGAPDDLELLTDRALLALQGPEAAGVLAPLLPPAGQMAFMDSAMLDGALFGDLIVSRSGYTGDDGFEISVAAEQAAALWEHLLRDERVRPVGLGARDSLRLEAGLPLYGHDIDETTSPVEAGLTFAIARDRREAGGFPGADRIRRELAEGPQRLRIGLLVEGAPAREGAEVLDEAGAVIGRVTSGGFSPTLGRPIAMAYALPTHIRLGTRLQVLVRGKAQPAEVASMPFVPHRYARKP